MDTKGKKKIILLIASIVIIAVVIGVGAVLTEQDKIIDPSELLTTENISSIVNIPVDAAERSSQEIIGLMSQSYKGEDPKKGSVTVTVTMVQESFMTSDPKDFNAKTYYDMTAIGKVKEELKYGSKSVLIGNTVHILTGKTYIAINCEKTLNNGDHAKALADIAYKNYKNLD